MASHGYLPAQFLNPRTDKYGGDDQRRLRFLLEVVDGIREAAGQDFDVGIRISGDEKSDQGADLRLQGSGKGRVRPGRADPGLYRPRTAMVIGGGPGGLKAAAAAERGHEVTLYEAGGGQVIEGTSLPQGCVVVADWRSDWIGLGICLQMAQAGHRVTLAVNAYQPGELLALAQGHEPVDDLVSGLHDYHGEVHAIGDCLSPRTVEEAVLEGLEVATHL